ncbi:hypothetical protein AGMMS49975_02170 [Clostridia bacterium]|nr:hypothetical protein AGMMS49975_02170 [Clostridia bacterium]
MIMGVAQKQEKDGEEFIWDYSGCYFPEGHMGGDTTYLFNADQIERVYFIGFQDEEQFGFKVKADAVLRNLRGETEESL